MATLTIRNVPDEIHRALKIRAAHNRRSAEAEVREILAETIRPKERLRIGTEMARFWDEHGNPDLDIRRDPQPVEPADFR
jgi:antitoxin FitA